MKTLLALVLLLLPTLLHAASSATVNGEVLVAPTNLVLRSVDPAKGTLRIILPAGMYTNGFAVYDSSSNLLFGVTSNGAFQAFSPWSVLGSSTNLMTGTNLPGADGDVLTKGATGLFMATPTGGGGGSSTNGLATTNFVNAGDAATSNHLETAKQPASLTLTNLSNTGAITNVADAGNAFISWIYTSNNFTILLKTISAGANLWITNNGTNIVIAGPSTNGFVTQTITNGLATISYVSGATQGLVTASVTNGLATISYVDTKLNSTSNSLLSQIISSQVWTNDGQIIHPVAQPTNGIVFARTNGGIMLGRNTRNIWGNFPLNGESLISWRDIENGDPDYNELFLATGTNGGYQATLDFYGDHTSWTTAQTVNHANGNSESRSIISDSAVSSILQVNNANRTTLIPTAPNDGTVPYLFDTSIAHTSGNLLEVKNNGSTKFSVDYGGGASFGSSGLYFISKDGDSDLATLLVLEFIADPALAFWHIESADGSAGFGGYNLRIGSDGNLDAVKNVAYVWPDANAIGFFYNDGFGGLSWTNLVSYPDHVTLTNGGNHIKSLSGGVTDQGTNVVVDISASASNALVNLSSNSVTMAPGTGTSISTSYVGGKVIYTVSDSEVASTMVKTNFVLNQVYTNTSVQPVLIKADTFMITAAVSGDCAVDLMYSPLGATSYALLSRVAIATTVAGGLALPITNTIVGVVTNLGSYYFTNTSSGIGNSAGLVGAGTGQYVIIGGGAQGPTGAAGAAGANGSSGVTWATNAIGATVGGASNEVFLVDTNLIINATNTATAGGTNTIKFSTAQPITTTASPTFSNLTVSGNLSVAALQQTGDANGGGKFFTNSYNLVERFQPTNTFLSLSNSSTETTIGSYLIKPYEIGTNSTISQTIEGDILQNSTTSTNIVFRCYLGGTKFFDSGNLAVAANSGRRTVKIIANCTMLDSASTNSEYISGSIRVGNVSAPTTGLGSISSSLLSDMDFSCAVTLASISMITNTEFYVTAQWAGAATAITIDRRSFRVQRQ